MMIASIGFFRTSLKTLAYIQGHSNVKEALKMQLFWHEF